MWDDGMTVSLHPSQDVGIHMRRVESLYHGVMGAHLEVRLKRNLSSDLEEIMPRDLYGSL